MANELTTLGITLNYAYEASSGVRPTTNYTKIAGIKATPDLSVAPAGIDVTDLEEDFARKYLPGLRDFGDDLAFTANLTSTLVTDWASLVSTAATKWASGLATWFEIKIPGLGKSYYFSGMPSALGVSALNVNEAAETECHIAPNGFHGFDAPSTIVT